MASPGVLIAAAARTHPTEVISGDIWHVDWLATGCRIAVIDGLGHGPDAAFAAQQASDTLALSPNLGPADALRVCHQALSGTRGAAIGIALIETSMGTLTYAGVGNVEARVVTPEKVSLLASSRGIVGSILPTIRPTEISLPPGWTLVMHSDGVSSRFDLSQIDGASGPDVKAVADAILAEWGRATDDATVVVARAANVLSGQTGMSNGAAYSTPDRS